MKAHLRSVRIAPKKANLIAKMVRGMPVPEAIDALGRTHKKGARLIEKLLKSAVANAEHNDKQDPSLLVIKTLVVNQGTAYRRGIPMARGRTRPISKFLSHISVTLGIATEEKSQKKQVNQKKDSKQRASQSRKTHVKVKGTSKEAKGQGGSSSSESSTSSSPSASS